MKTFIVFMAFVLVFGSFLVFSNDLAGLKRLQEQLKIVAEECACGGALLTGDGENHSAIIRESDALAYVLWYTNLVQAEKPLFRNGTLHSEAELLSPRSLRVTVSFVSDRPLFHFLSMNLHNVSRAAVYEWVVQ